MSIKLVSNDGQSLDVNPAVLTKSKFFQKQISNGSKEIQVTDIKGDVLKYVIDYLNHYQDTEPERIPEVLKSTDLKNDIKSNWDVDFISQISFENVFHLINAGVLLELDHLHDLACARIAVFMKDKSTDDINQEFTIECQLTAEEAKELGLDAPEADA
jgi:hypothetical protein